MCKLKLRFPSSLPPRGNPARLPALLVPILALAAGLQLVLPGNSQLPPAGAVAHGLRSAMPMAAAMVDLPPALVERNLFSSGGGETADAAPDPLGGAVFAGAVQQGGRKLAVVQMPQGRVRYVATGGTIAGWRLVQMLPQGVRVKSGGQTMTVLYGQRAPLSPIPAHSQSEEEQ
jgi:hypothetical protein